MPPSRGAEAPLRGVLGGGRPTGRGCPPEWPARRAEDLHRADEGSLCLLGLLAGSTTVAAGRVADIPQHRDQSYSRVPAHGRGLRGRSSRRVGRPDAGGCGPVVADRGPGGKDAGLVHRRTVATRSSSTNCSGWAAPLSWCPVLELVRRRVALPPEDTRVGLRTAVLGRDFEEATLAAMLARGPAVLASPAVDLALRRQCALRGRAYRASAMPASTAASSAVFFISWASSVNSSRAGLMPSSVNSRSMRVRWAPQTSARMRRR